MSMTDPLVHKPPNSADTDFERLLESKRQEAKTISGWSSLLVTSFTGKHTELTQNLAALKDFHADYSDCLSSMQDGNPARKLELIFRLAQKYGDSEGIVGEVYSIFADKTDSHFGPVSDDEVDSAYTDLLALMQSSWEGFSLMDIGSTQTVAGDVDWDGNGTKRDIKAVRDMMSQKKNAFTEYAATELFKIAERHKGSALFWFLLVLWESMLQGTFGWLSFPGLFNNSRKNVKRLRWCELGFRVQAMISLQKINPQAVYVSPYTIVQYDVYSGTVAPQFGKQLTELQSLLEAHLVNADYLRNKALAYFTAFLIFLGNLLASIIAGWTGGWEKAVNDKLGLNFTSSE